MDVTLIGAKVGAWWGMFFGIFIALVTPYALQSFYDPPVFLVGNLFVYLTVGAVTGTIVGSAFGALMNLLLSHRRREKAKEHWSDRV